MGGVCEMYDKSKLERKINKSRFVMFRLSKLLSELSDSVSTKIRKAVLYKVIHVV